MENITKNLQLGLLTIILIAHRLNTVSKCDQIIEIKNGEINKFP